MYVQDYGAPVGWRLALAHPESVSAIITQNGNGYEAGFAQAFWKPVREYWHDHNARNRGRRPPGPHSGRHQVAVPARRTRSQSLVSPDTWSHDYALVSRPGNDLVQLKLFADYASNLAVYPKMHAYLRRPAAFR